MAADPPTTAAHSEPAHQLCPACREQRAAACCGRIEHAVELVMRRHLPVEPDEDGPVLCLCDVTQTYDGPVSQRRHVAVELRKAGLLRG